MDGLCIVAARGGSKRLPGKNLRKLGGRSLLAHTAEAIEGAQLDIPVVLSTDDQAIAKEGGRLGWEIPGLRPARLAGDDAAIIDVLLYELGRYERRTGITPEAVLLLQPTSPFRGSECLELAVELLRQRTEIDTIISMMPVGVPASKMFHLNERGIAQAVSSDERSPVYVPNGALYLCRTNALRAEKTVYAGEILAIAMDRIQSLDIDTMDDFNLASAILETGIWKGQNRPLKIFPSKSAF